MNTEAATLASVVVRMERVILAVMVQSVGLDVMAWEECTPAESAA